MNKMSLVLKEVLEKVKPTQEEIKEISIYLKNFLDKLESNKKKAKISAEIFVGGSFAKKTMIKKNHYDIDIFIRFDQKHMKQNLSDLTKKILGRIPAERVHGSRDYFKVKVKDGLFFEVVPVKKIKNQKEAENVTDLSYFHVRYVNKNFNEKVLDEIRIVKAFCHANGCYGAESYIGGFSGYALELLTYNYGSFEKFLKAMTKTKTQEKLILDKEKQYKNKAQVLMDINTAKLHSPVILIDPTHKQRNVLAALSKETFEKFKKVSNDFLKGAKISFFEQKNVDVSKLGEKARGKGYETVLLEAKTNRQEGDIAGSKLLKFYKYFEKEVDRFFKIDNKNFEYEGHKTARFMFIVSKNRDVLFKGPEIKDKDNLKRFKSKHKKTFIKAGRVYSKENTDLSLKEFIIRWIKDNADRIKEMYIVDFKILKF